MTLTRTRYRERAFLRQSDLASEQAYRMAMRRRHNLGGHGWGIVMGLEIVPTAAGPQVQPGFAIDGYGRELIVPAPILIPDSTFAELGPAVELVDVWLIYFAEPLVSHRRDGQSISWHEQARLRVEAATRDRPLDSRAPGLVPNDDYNFGPQRVPPSDPQAAWPVFLGRIARDKTTTPPTYTELPLSRPFAALRGELIVSPPAGRTPELAVKQPTAAKLPEGVRIQIGAELATDRRRFAVALPDTSGAYIDRFTINGDGSADFGGPTTLHAQLTLASVLLRTEDLLDPLVLAHTLADQSDPVSQRVAQRQLGWTAVFAQRLAEFWHPSGLQSVLRARLNALLMDAEFYDAQQFADLPIRDATRKAIARRLGGADSATMNRMLLEDAYPSLIARRTSEPDDIGAIEFRPLAEPPKAAAPWQIYRVKIAKDGIETNTLRFEILNPGKQGDPPRNLFAIGHSVDGVFVADLAVAANGTLTVNEIDVKDGQVVEQPIAADPNDPRFAEKVIEGLEQGLAVMTNLRFELADVPDTAMAGTPLTYTITLTNSAAFELTNIVVYATQIVSGVVRHQNTVLATSLRLAADAFATLNTGDLAITVPNDPGRDIQIILTAMGTVPPTGRAFGSASKLTRITAYQGGLL